MNLYNTDRGPESLEPHYSRHITAMTVEGLHSKADIAQELACRDAQIECLQKIIDSRPPINAGLIEAYINWSHSIYQMEAYSILETRK